jgi:hypothetical protein
MMPCDAQRYPVSVLLLLQLGIARVLRLRHALCVVVVGNQLQAMQASPMCSMIVAGAGRRPLGVALAIVARC